MPAAPDTLSRLYTLRSFVRDVATDEARARNLIRATKLFALASELADLISEVEQHESQQFSPRPNPRA